MVSVENNISFKPDFFQPTPPSSCASQKLKRKKAFWKHAETPIHLIQYAKGEYFPPYVIKINKCLPLRISQNYLEKQYKIKTVFNLKERCKQEG